MPIGRVADRSSLDEAAGSGGFAWPRLVLLLGPPAAGKDTLSGGAAAISGGRFVNFRKVRDSGAGYGRNYQVVTPEDFDRSIGENRFLQWHGRYGRRYGVLREDIRALLESGTAPLIHIGRAGNLRPFLDSGLPCSVVLLWAPRRTILARLMARHDGDPSEVCARYRAYVAERNDIRRAGDTLEIDFMFDTSRWDREETVLTFCKFLGSLAKRSSPPISQKAWDAIHHIR